MLGSVMADKTTKQRRKERLDHRFRVQFHSVERVDFFRHLPCELTGIQIYGEVVCAHTKGGGVGRRGTYKSIVPLEWKAHKDFDEMPNDKFEKTYGRTKASVRDRAPFYDQLWRKAT